MSWAEIGAASYMALLVADETKGASKMKVIYDEGCDSIYMGTRIVVDVAGSNMFGDPLVFCINKNIPLDIATKLFQRWHQIDQSAEPEFIARALNDALNSDLTVRTLDSKGVFLESAIYCDNSEFDGANIAYRVRLLKNIQMSVDVSVKHNITEDRVDYFIDDNLKGWLPIVRKEITS